MTCLDCSLPISRSALRCRSCSRKGSLNPIAGKSRPQHVRDFACRINGGDPDRRRAGEKKCSDCQKWLSASLDFYKNSSRTDGLDVLCKPCRTARASVAMARRRGAAGKCSPAQWRARWAYYGGLCWMCRAPAEQMDHVIPIAKGGTNWPSNLRPACRPCNRRKSAGSWREYITIRLKALPDV